MTGKTPASASVHMSTVETANSRTGTIRKVEQEFPRDELCLLCEKCIRLAGGKGVTMETHIEQFLDEEEVQQSNARDFVTHTVLGIDRHYKLLEVGP